ncbi:N-formylglutamate amidohydrolase [Sinimarinibacterium flocculans]|uniref:N-formylglutamate amidohydrolase n=1 Tax=Sinimarinibacterium flocculans TaxID=985250 RepID=UPI002490A8D3|nr:N-formylglutamate amidohydrolase [Sinimarinibacterium flocculans]
MHDPQAVYRVALLAADEVPAVSLEGEARCSQYVTICDHAGNLIPRKLAMLGLQEAELQRHIAWDIGAAGVSRNLACALDGPVILQNYSRLVIDCNRPLSSGESIALRSEHTVIPGNRNLSWMATRQRAEEIFSPYHSCIRATLDARLQRKQDTVLISMHSFTPTYLGKRRPWHIGVLYNRDARLANALITALRAESGLTVGDNEPYEVGDDTDYSIPEYGERRGLLHVGIEIRQDLVCNEAGQRQWAARLERLLSGCSSIAHTC